jgi:hypothetical protein
LKSACQKKFMPVRIYDIARTLGMPNKEVIARAKDLGIANAKVPSSSIDKISAEYLIKELGGQREEESPATTGAEGITVVTKDDDEARAEQTNEAPAEETSHEAQSAGEPVMEEPSIKVIHAEPEDAGDEQAEENAQPDTELEPVVEKEPVEATPDL